MKKSLRIFSRAAILASLLSSFFFVFSVSAQSPNKLSYQAVVRDAGSKLIQNQSVGLQISILQGNATGSVVYSENHTVSSDADGLVTLEIGAGTPILGNFASIDW